MRAFACAQRARPCMHRRRRAIVLVVYRLSEVRCILGAQNIAALSELVCHRGFQVVAYFSAEITAGDDARLTLTERGAR